jgi:hypothetical protein
VRFAGQGNACCPSFVGGAVGLVIADWFPYRRRFLLVILNLPGAIAVGAVFTITYPATAITMWANLHRRLLSINRRTWASLVVPSLRRQDDYDERRKDH